MASNIPPAREAEFVPWLTNFHDRVVAETGHFGVPAPIVTGYTTAYNAFMAAYAIAIDPETRTRSAIAEKDTTKIEVRRQTRHIMGVLQAMPTVSDAQRVLLGMHIHDVDPTPIPAPAHAPQLSITSVINRTVRIKLGDATDPTRRGRPLGVQGAAIFSYVGPSAPTEASAWRFEGNTTRTAAIDITFADTVAAGAQVWFTAFWFNPRALSGPGCAAVGTNLQGGSAMAA